jgi:hypothetical protein
MCGIISGAKAAKISPEELIKKTRNSAGEAWRTWRRGG